MMKFFASPAKPVPIPPLHVSVIAPTLDEAANISAFLRRVHALRHANRLLCEILVCDGGSQDDTRELATQNGARVLTGARGRGPQMNLGARSASSDVLWFLHADAKPHAWSLREIERAVARGNIGGNFRLRFASRGVWARTFDAIAFVQRSLGTAYGDSGIWATREAFACASGFPDWPLFEDYEFWRRLKRVGRVHRAGLPLQTSARRFERAPLNTLVLWLKLQVLFRAGVAPEVLAQQYRAQK